MLVQVLLSRIKKKLEIQEVQVTTEPEQVKHGEVHKSHLEPLTIVLLTQF